MELQDIITGALVLNVALACLNVMMFHSYLTQRWSIYKSQRMCYVFLTIYVANAAGAIGTLIFLGPANVLGCLTSIYGQGRPFGSIVITTALVVQLTILLASPLLYWMTHRFPHKMAKRINGEYVLTSQVRAHKRELKERNLAG